MFIVTQFFLNVPSIHIAKSLLSPSMHPDFSDLSNGLQESVILLVLGSSSDV